MAAGWSRIGSLTNFQSSKPSSIPGIPATKNAPRQPTRAAICVVRTGARARPTSAAALTTTPTFRPRRSGAEDSSTVAVIVDQVGPSAKPINTRTVNSSPKDVTIPESQDRTEKAKTAGSRTGRRPMRSETAPKIKPEIAQARASAETSNPTSYRADGRTGSGSLFFALAFRMEKVRLFAARGTVEKQY